MEKVKNETDATFSHVYDVLASEFCPFSHLSSGMKVIQLFKAKMEAFRDKNPEKAETDQKFILRTVGTKSVPQNFNSELSI